MKSELTFRVLGNLEPHVDVYIYLELLANSETYFFTRVSFSQNAFRNGSKPLL